MVVYNFVDLISIPNITMDESLSMGDWGYYDTVGMLFFLQTILFWINHLSYVHLCRQLCHMKTMLTVFFLLLPVPKNHQFDIIFCPVRISPFISH